MGEARNHAGEGQTRRAQMTDRLLELIGAGEFVDGRVVAPALVYGPTLNIIHRENAPVQGSAFM